MHVGTSPLHHAEPRERARERESQRDRERYREREDERKREKKYSFVLLVSRSSDEDWPSVQDVIEAGEKRESRSGQTSKSSEIEILPPAFKRMMDRICHHSMLLK
jgi:hypothetical protein